MTDGPASEDPRTVAEAVREQAKKRKGRYIWLPDGSEMAISDSVDAVTIARLTLKDSLHWWDIEHKDLSTVPIDRFLMVRTYPRPAPSIPEEFKHRYPLNELRSEIIEEQVVNVESLKTATSAEKKVLHDYCADNEIDMPNELALFMKETKKVPVHLVDSAKSQFRDEALFWAVANVVDLTGLPVALNEKSMGRGGTGCAVEVVYEAMRCDLGQHVRLKPGTIKKAYERVNRLPVQLDK